MKTIISCFLLILFLACSYNAQTKRMAARLKPKPLPTKPCTLSKEDKITFRGFYLGQHKDELSDLPNFDSIYKKMATPGVLPLSSLGLVQLEKRDFSDRLLGVKYSDVGFSLNFLDDKMMSLSIDYSDYEPKNLSVFIAQISNTTLLPFDSWTIDSRSSRAIMKCADFEVYAFRNSYISSSIHITDSVAEAELTRRAEKSERARAEAEKERKRIELERKRIFKP